MGITCKSPKLSQKRMIMIPGATWLRQILLLSFVTILPFFIPSKTALIKKKSVFHFEMKIFYVLQKQTDNIFGWNTQSAAGHTREMQRAGSSQPSLKALTASTRA